MVVFIRKLKILIFFGMISSASIGQYHYVAIAPYMPLGAIHTKAPGISFQYFFNFSSHHTIGASFNTGYSKIENVDGIVDSTTLSFAYAFDSTNWKAKMSPTASIYYRFMVNDWFFLGATLNAGFRDEEFLARRTSRSQYNYADQTTYWTQAALADYNIRSLMFRLDLGGGFLIPFTDHLFGSFQTSVSFEYIKAPLDKYLTTQTEGFPYSSDYNKYTTFSPASGLHLGGVLQIAFGYKFWKGSILPSFSKKQK